MSGHANMGAKSLPGLFSHAVWKPIALVVALQLGVLGWMVLDRVRLLSHGQEIVLDVVPVDPRSLFRGDYVVLAYDVSRINAALMEGQPKPNAPFYVTIGRGAAQSGGAGAMGAGTANGEPAADNGSRWTVLKASYEKPMAANGQVVLKALPDGRVRTSNQSSIVARYGIESYFVSEGQGLELEKLVGEKKIKAVVAVGRDGTAAIKGLTVDGKLVHRESLF